MKTMVLRSTELAGVYVSAPMRKLSARDPNGYELPPCTGCAFDGHAKACMAADDCVYDNIIWIKKEQS